MALALTASEVQKCQPSYLCISWWLWERVKWGKLLWLIRCVVKLYGLKSFPLTNLSFLEDVTKQFCKLLRSNH
jgi:hypothetical protein